MLLDHPTYGSPHPSPLQPMLLPWTPCGQPSSAYSQCLLTTRWHPLLPLQPMPVYHPVASLASPAANTCLPPGGFPCRQGHLTTLRHILLPQQPVLSDHCLASLTTIAAFKRPARPSKETWTREHALTGAEVPQLQLTAFLKAVLGRGRLTG